jgi:hypothetical protein
MLLEFDFEADIEKLLPKLSEDAAYRMGDQKHRVIVCRHWLLGLCHNGNDCTYLHRLDKSKMPACKHGKLCKIKNCPLKHVSDEEVEECLFYKQGFCYNGLKCGRRHVKRMPEDCPLESTFESNIPGQNQIGKKFRLNSQPNDNYKVTICTHWLLSGACHFDEECHFAHGEHEINEGFQPNSEFLRDDDIYDPTAFNMDSPLELPFPTTARSSYFLLQSPDLRSLAIAKRRGVWSIPTRMAAEINASFRASDHVIFYFSVRSLKGIYGVAKLASMIPIANSHMTPEFSITWLRTLRISMRTLAQLKLGNTGMFIGRCTVDGRFENKVGLDILLIAYRKPNWDWSLEMEKAEQNIRLIEKSYVNHNSNNIGEYYPSTGKIPYHLQPDVLFEKDWIDRQTLISTDNKINHTKMQNVFFQAPASAINLNNNINNSNINNYSSNNITSINNSNIGMAAISTNVIVNANEAYNGDLPGFIFCAPTVVVEEMFSK